ncbi:hypothetical protein MKW94_015014 [Papaver nudicaule]|uniref:Uncharacterized protein n=1 Tax=Papaver nudicaule TaxID=74823 RepID=A0AA41VW58_PAPNU|nr:hypothetical protein [Papaver nudicaule]
MHISLQQFVDQCGTIDDIKRAWERHRKLFPHLMSRTSYNGITESQDTIISLPSNAPEDKVSGISTECLMLDQKPASPKGPAFSNGTPSEGIDDTKKTRQPQVSPEVVEQSEKNVMEQNSRDDDLVNEVNKQCKTSISVQHRLEGENEEKGDLDVEPKNTSKPLELENLSINPRDEESRDLAPTVSHDSEDPRPDPRSHASEPEKDACMKSDHLSQVHVQTDSGPSHTSANPSLQPTQLQSQPPGLRNNLSDSSAVSGGNWSQINSSWQTPGDTRSSFQGYPQNQSSVTQSGVVLHQFYPQSGQYPQMQPASIVQQQSYAFVQPPPAQAGSQPVSFSQTQMHPYQMQASQAYINQLWHYYYQQQQLHQQQLVLQQQQQNLVPQQILVPQQQQQILVPQQQQQPQLQLQPQQTPLQTHSWVQSSYYQQSQGTTQPNSKASVPASPLGAKSHPPTK